MLHLSGLGFTAKDADLRVNCHWHDSVEGSQIVEASYPGFRRRLDDILRRRDPAALRDFMIAEGQWTPETSTDPERAMWMMIAASPALRPLHDQAGHWLADHGYTEEARAILGRREGGTPHQHSPAQRGQAGRQGPRRHGGRNAARPPRPRP